MDSRKIHCWFANESTTMSAYKVFQDSAAFTAHVFQFPDVELLLDRVREMVVISSSG